MGGNESVPGPDFVGIFRTETLKPKSRSAAGECIPCWDILLSYIQWLMGWNQAICCSISLASRPVWFSSIERPVAWARSHASQNAEFPTIFLFISATFELSYGWSLMIYDGIRTFQADSSVCQVAQSGGWFKASVWWLQVLSHDHRNWLTARWVSQLVLYWNHMRIMWVRGLIMSVADCVRLIWNVSLALVKLHILLLPASLHLQTTVASHLYISALSIVDGFLRISNIYIHVILLIDLKNAEFWSSVWKFWRCSNRL
jgi:hypothetical protein